MKIKSKTALFVIFFILVTVPGVRAADIVFSRLRISNDSIILNFSIQNYQRKDIVEAIKRGIEVRVLYHIEVIKKTALGLFEDRIISRTMHRSVKYDFWKRAYLVKSRSKTVQFHGEQAMLDALFVAQNINLGGVGQLARKDHVLRVKAEVSSIQLYFPMNYIFKYIIGIWDFNTGWKSGPPLQGLR